MSPKKVTALIKKLKSVRIFLFVCLIASVLFAVYSINYKIKYWGFSTNARSLTDIWTIEAHINFTPTDEPVKISIARPATNDDYKILGEDVVAPDYDVKTTANRILITSDPKNPQIAQDIYYRVLLYKNINPVQKLQKISAPKVSDVPLSEQELEIASQLLETSKQYDGTRAQQVIALLNRPQPEAIVQTFLPERKTPKDTALVLHRLLAVEKIPSRIVRGIKLVEEKKTFSADILLEVFEKGVWQVYNVETGVGGIPKDFVIFQREGNSLIDVEGGVDSAIKFSVLKSVRSAFSMAKHRSKGLQNLKIFDYEFSIYNLPVSQQNALKWLMIFPLAILVVVIMRNIVGLKTMGTFTPMLISMALIQTGFAAGLICFGIIIGVGLLIRTLLSRFNLLLVPRISSVVIFVILIIQFFTVWGYDAKINIASSALFFPIIIMAWIIERASITWEEEGTKNALTEMFYTVLVGIIVYFVVANEFIRHIMFAFNELNLVILCIVMLLGTYTGYRLTELMRFAPLANAEKSKKRILK